MLLPHPISEDSGVRPGEFACRQVILPQSMLGSCLFGTSFPTLIIYLLHPLHATMCISMPKLAFPAQPFQSIFSHKEALDCIAHVLC